MAILIVDDESSTRAALRDLLTQLGHKTILEAKHGEEGLKVAETEKNRLRMIIADWEMPYMDGITMLERIGAIGDLDLTPFLLITSDLPRARLSELQERTNRLDGFLIKPFRMKALSEAMHQAQAHRALTRDVLILVQAAPDPASEALAQGAVLAKEQNWSAPVVARDLAALQEAVRAGGPRVGAIVIDPSSPLPGVPEWIAQWGRSRFGTSTPVVCASRQAEQVMPFRNQCQFFVPQGTTAAGWADTLSRVRVKMRNTLETELLFQELKATLQTKEGKTSREAMTAAKRLLEIDPTSGEANTAIADLLEAQGKRAEAIQHYRLALDAHPCQPRSYIRLLDLMMRDVAQGAAQGVAVTPIIEDAVRFCPQSQDVLLAAARASQGAGDATRATEIARRILALNPTHADALAMLA